MATACAARVNEARLGRCGSGCSKGGRVKLPRLWATGKVEVVRIELSCSMASASVSKARLGPCVGSSCSEGGRMKLPRLTAAGVVEVEGIELSRSNVGGVVVAIELRRCLWDAAALLCWRLSCSSGTECCVSEPRRWRCPPAAGAGLLSVPKLLRMACSVYDLLRIGKGAWVLCRSVATITSKRLSEIREAILSGFTPTGSSKNVRKSSSSLSSDASDARPMDMAREGCCAYLSRRRERESERRHRELNSSMNSLPNYKQ